MVYCNFEKYAYNKWYIVILNIVKSQNNSIIDIKELVITFTY